MITSVLGLVGGRSGEPSRWQGQEGDCAARLWGYLQTAERPRGVSGSGSSLPPSASRCFSLRLAVLGLTLLSVHVTP